jgi:hypothetical protein
MRVKEIVDPKCEWNPPCEKLPTDVMYDNEGKEFRLCSIHARQSRKYGWMPWIRDR